jgi:hypothetical protein
MRKIIQFQVYHDHHYAYVYALCDDGTLWEQVGEDPWKELKAPGMEQEMPPLSTVFCDQVMVKAKAQL